MIIPNLPKRLNIHHLWKHVRNIPDALGSGVVFLAAWAVRWPRYCCYFLLYGKKSPRPLELLHVDPLAVMRASGSAPELRRFSDFKSGKIAPGDWDLKVKRVDLSPDTPQKRPKYLYRRIVQGKTWEESGAYEYMLDLMQRKPGTDGLHSRDDVRKRLAELDLLIENLKAGKRLEPSQWEPGYYSRNDIWVHIGRNGEIIQARGGGHRLIIAQILKLPSIPVRIGLVHLKAIESGAYGLLLERYR